MTIISIAWPPPTGGNCGITRASPNPPGILSSTSAAVSGEFAVVPYTSGEIYALRVQNGQQAWSDVLSRSGRVTALSELDDIAGRPVIDRNVVYAVSQSGVMAAINLPTGERLWSRDIAGIQTPWRRAIMSMCWTPRTASSA